MRPKTFSNHLSSFPGTLRCFFQKLVKGEKQQGTKTKQGQSFNFGFGFNSLCSFYFRTAVLHPHAIVPTFFFCYISCARILAKLFVKSVNSSLLCTCKHFHLEWPPKKVLEGTTMSAQMDETTTMDKPREILRNNQ